MLYEIVNAEAHLDHTVTIRWSDGGQATVDLAPIIARGKVFAPMQDAVWFKREMRILPHGLGLSWPPEVDFSADGLRYRAFPEEAEPEFGSPPDAACVSPASAQAPGDGRSLAQGWNSDCLRD